MEITMVSKTLKEALLDAWDALIPLVGINLVWFILTILVVTAFPAFGGLYYATNRIAHGEMADMRIFFDGFKTHFWTSMKWGFLNLVVYFMLTMNIWFYGQFEGFGYVILQSLFFSAILIYTCMQLYTFPFLLEQDEPSLKIAIRNSFAAFVRFMGRSFGLLFFFLILSIASTLLPPLWLLITMSVIVYFGNWNTLVVIQKLKALETSDESETETN
jgi:uncharacterized membrane protein YesL